MYTLIILLYTLISTIAEITETFYLKHFSIIFLFQLSVFILDFFLVVHQAFICQCINGNHLPTGTIDNAFQINLIYIIPASYRERREQQIREDVEVSLDSVTDGPKRGHRLNFN